MATLQAEQFGDLVRSTINELGEPNFTNLMSDLRDFPGAKVLLKQKRIAVQAGPQIQWNIAVDSNGRARNVAITDHDQIGQRDGQVQAQVPWRATTTDYSLYHEVMAMNRKPRQIVDLVKFNRAQSMTAWVELMEQNIWRAPSASDVRTPYGIPYWITKNGTEGWTGGVLSGFTTVANVSPTTYPRWQNWAGPYTNPTQDDLVRRARKMARRTNFKPAVDNLPSHDKASSLMYYTNDDVFASLEEILDAKNDNHGNELAKYDGTVRFRRADVETIPQLDEDTTNPFYQIDWGTVGIAVLKDFWAKETVWDKYPGQHNVTATIIDYVYNIICYNRRKNGVLATGTSYP